jgi:hypothetical protein
LTEPHGTPQELAVNATKGLSNIVVGRFAIVKAAGAIRTLIGDYLHAQPQVMIAFRMGGSYSGNFSAMNV